MINLYEKDIQKSKKYVEIFLQPGEFFFSGHKTRIRTILGSCVAMTFWHPIKLIGGMTHIMLPTRGNLGQKIDAELNGKYADDALKLILNELENTNTYPYEYQVKLFGGGHMFPKNTEFDNQHIGAKNSIAVRSFIEKNGFSLHAEHLGGIGHRSIIFDIWSGHVWVKHNPEQVLIDQ